MQFIPGGMIFVLLCAPLFWRSREVRLLALTLGICAVALAVETWGYQHYGAPAGTVAVLLVAVLANDLWHWRAKGARVGAIAIGVILAASFAYGIYRPFTLRDTPADLNVRPRVIQRIRSNGLRNVVFVHYTNTCATQEWVYNSADIDSQRVIFAHDLGESANRALLNYYRGRVFWDLWFDSCDYSAVPALARRM